MACIRIFVPHIRVQDHVRTKFHDKQVQASIPKDSMSYEASIPHSKIKVECYLRPASDNPQFMQSVISK